MVQQACLEEAENQFEEWIGLYTYCGEHLVIIYTHVCICIYGKKYIYINKIYNIESYVVHLKPVYYYISTIFQMKEWVGLLFLLIKSFL